MGRRPSKSEERFPWNLTWRRHWWCQQQLHLLQSQKSRKCYLGAIVVQTLRSRQCAANSVSVWEAGSPSICALLTRSEWRAQKLSLKTDEQKEVYARVHPLLLLPLIDYVRCRANFYNIILLIRLDLSSKLLLYTFALHSHLLAPTLFRFLSRICKNLLFKHLQI